MGSVLGSMKRSHQTLGTHRRVAQVKIMDMSRVSIHFSIGSSVALYSNVCFSKQTSLVSYSK